jgi:hypothetical protein
MRKGSAQSGPHRPPANPGPPPQGADQTAPGGTGANYAGTRALPKFTKSASSLTSQSRDSPSPDGRNSWLNGDARPSRSAKPATTPSTPGSQPRPPRRNHWRATCAERRMRRFGRRALEKDLPSRHLASVLPHLSGDCADACLSHGPCALRDIVKESVDVPTGGPFCPQAGLLFCLPQGREQPTVDVSGVGAVHDAPDVQTVRSAGNRRTFDHVQQDGPDGREVV